jgi:hypothetical protein
MLKTYLSVLAVLLAVACGNDVTFPHYSSRAARAKVTPLPSDSVVTPGGYRLRTNAHVVYHDLRVTAGHIQEVDPAGSVLNDFGAYADSGGNQALFPHHVSKRHVPGMGTGWITYAYWNRPSGQPFTYDSATWVVPAGPANTTDGQLVYLFNGLQGSSWIIQPVLQWGTSPAGGGAYWAATCWYVDGGGSYQDSTLVTVYAGDTVRGIISGGPNGGGSYNYTCRLRTPRGSRSWSVSGVAELWQAVNTLEAYSIAQCPDYPSQDSTAFQVNKVQTSSGTPSLTWGAVDPVQDCGQNTQTVSNANPNGEADLYYFTGLPLGISGTNSTGQYTQCSWTGTVTGGTPPYIFAWTGATPSNQTDTTSSTSDYFGNLSPAWNFTITATVTDSNGWQGYAALGVNVNGFGC